MERSKAPATAAAPALDMFAEEDQKTKEDISKENTDQQGQDCVGKILLVCLLFLRFMHSGPLYTCEMHVRNT